MLPYSMFGAAGKPELAAWVDQASKGAREEADRTSPAIVLRAVLTSESVLTSRWRTQSASFIYAFLVDTSAAPDSEPVVNSEPIKNPLCHEGV